jgi:hypothetical protein
VCGCVCGCVPCVWVCVGVCGCVCGCVPCVWVCVCVCPVCTLCVSVCPVCAPIVTDTGDAEMGVNLNLTMLPAKLKPAGYATHQIGRYINTHNTLGT